MLAKRKWTRSPSLVSALENHLRTQANYRKAGFEFLKLKKKETVGKRRKRKKERVVSRRREEKTVTQVCERDEMRWKKRQEKVEMKKLVEQDKEDDDKYITQQYNENPDEDAFNWGK